MLGRGRRSAGARMLGAAAVALAVASLVLSGPAAAAGVEGTWGKVGAHHVKRVGATCVYVSTPDLQSIVDIVIKPPRVFASSGTQTVGWRSRIQARPIASHEAWKTIIALPVEKKTATIGTAAAFSAQSTGKGVGANRYIGDEYRVVVDMVWYRSGNAVGGAAKLVSRLATAGGTPQPTCIWGGN